MTVLVRFQLKFLNNRSKVYCIPRSFAEQAFSRTQQYTKIDCPLLNDFAQNTKRKLKMMSKFMGGCLEVQGEPGGAAGGLRTEGVNRFV